jgi:hypothetical protein
MTKSYHGGVTARIAFALSLGLGACSTSLLGLPSRETVARIVSSGAGTQHACVVPYRRGEHAPYAWIYSEEQQRLVLWERDATENARSLDLRTQVADTESGVGKDGHLVARAWVDDVLRDCRTSGVRYTIEPAR